MRFSPSWSFNRCRFGLVVVTLVIFTTSANAVAGPIRAGAFAQDITPPFPISMNGGMQDRTAKRAHDPLHARCLVLSDGRKTLAIVVCDCCMIPRELVDQAKEKASATTGIPVEAMLISATHTHTAPTLAGSFQSEADDSYRAMLVDRIAQGIAKANANLAPAKVGYGVARNERQLNNRRWRMKPGTIGPNPFGTEADQVRMNPPVGSADLVEPAGPVDPEVSILAVQSEGGQPIALLANYSLHYVGDVPPECVSADYFGEFCEQIRSRLKAPSDASPAFVGILSNGTSGDVNNINFRTPRTPGQPFEQTRLVASDVADSAFEAYKNIKFQVDVSVDFAEKSLELAVRKPDAKDIARAREILEKAGDRVLATLPEVYARETVLLADFPDTVQLKLQALRIGDLGIAAIPCETFTDIGLAIKRESPLKPTFTISLANGYNGYLPTPEHHALGGYETWRARSSYLEVDAAPKIQRVLLEMLDQIASRAGDSP
jgi:neutral ceramidase